MQELKEIIRDIEVRQWIGKSDHKITSVHFDSRACDKDSLFVAVQGTQADGHRFIPQAIENGARVILCSQLPEKLFKDITYVQVDDSSYALGQASSAFYGNPSGELNLIGVTGTNGKTTIVNLLYQLSRLLGYKAGVLSTIGNKIEGREIGATHTTPDPVQINRLLREMVDSGCDYCFMECSSHAIEQNRIAGLTFSGGIFTNITHDHLDYHKTFEAYLRAKKRFFDNLPSSAFALANIDDRNGEIMLQNTQAARYTYALKKPADFKARIIENQFEGLHLNLQGSDLWVKLVGSFNASNVLAVFGAARLLGHDKEDVMKALSMLEIVEGRFDYIRTPGNITGIVDYAHTPDAIKNVLETINDIRTRNEILITVIGAGGDRDPSKRPAMGKIAGRLSNRLLLTSDNPRSEEPDSIIRMIREGVDPSDTGKVIVIPDRREAIKTACLMAKPNDIILVAGKGHEKYQEIKGVKYPFDDKLLLKEFLNLKPNNN